MYQVVFTGKINTGVERSQAEAGLVRLFKATPQQVTWLLRGVPVVVKSTPDRALADRYLQALTEVGLDCLLRESGAKAATSARPSAKAAGPAPSTTAPLQSSLPGFSSETGPRSTPAKPVDTSVVPAPARPSIHPQASSTATGSPLAKPAPAKPLLSKPPGIAKPASPAGAAASSVAVPSSRASALPISKRDISKPTIAAPVVRSVGDAVSPAAMPRVPEPTSPVEPVAQEASRLRGVLYVSAIAAVVGVALWFLLNKVFPATQKVHPQTEAASNTPLAKSAAPAPAGNSDKPVNLPKGLIGRWMCMSNNFVHKGENVFTEDGSYHALAYGDRDSPLMTEVFDQEVAGTYWLQGNTIFLHITRIPTRANFGGSTSVSEYSSAQIETINDASMSWSFKAKGYIETEGCMRAMPGYHEPW